MSKKIMKTIALIVFLVIVGLSGMNSTNATSVIKSTECSYDFDFKGYKDLRSKGTVIVKIQLGKDAKIKVKYDYPAQYGTKTFDGNVKNFQSGSSYFSGYDYYIKDDKYQCPPSIFYIAFDQKGLSNAAFWNPHSTYIYFHDNTNLSDIKDKAQHDIGKDCGDHILRGPFDAEIGGYYTDCVNMPLSKTEHDEEEEPEPEPDPTECELNPEACEDPDINSNIVKPLQPSDNRTYSCGNEMLTGINANLLKVTSYAYNILRIIVPLALIILGSMDLIKGIMAQKEDEIKKGQQTFIKRLITAIIIFFVFAIVKFLIGIFASTNSADIVDCLNCIIDGADSSSCVRES